MIIHVKLFAILRDKANRGELELDLPENATVQTAAEALYAQFPDLREHGRHAAFAVNRTYAAISTRLNDGDELAVIPPVSGG